MTIKYSQFIPIFTTYFQKRYNEDNKDEMKTMKIQKVA